MQWFRNLKTAAKISVLVLFSSLFIGVVGFVGYYSNTKLADMIANLYTHNLQPVKHLSVAQAYVRSIEGLMLEMMLPNVPKERETAIVNKLREDSGNLERELGEFEQLEMDQTQREKLEHLRGELATVRNNRERAMNFAYAGLKARAYEIYINEVAGHHNSINDDLAQLAQFSNEQAGQAVGNARAVAAISNKLSSGITLAALLLSGFIGLMIARMISNPLNKVVAIVREVAQGNLAVETNGITDRDEVGQLAGEIYTMTGNLHAIVRQVAQTAEQLAAASEQLTASADQSAQAATQVADVINDVVRGTEKQVQSVDITSHTLGELSKRIQQVAANANNAAATSGKTVSAADAGSKSVHTAISQMNTIEKTVLGSAEVVVKLGDRSREIGQIVDTIADIAGQTNLLALNAAIEAARAGEQGRGFAVVAEEVRKLAEQSEEAAKKIGALIGEIQADTDAAVAAMSDGTREVKKGTEVVDGTGATFTEITTLVNQVLTQVGEISSVLQQMAGNSQQIVASIQEIDLVTKDTAGHTQTVSAATEEQSASMQEIAASSQALARMSEELQDVVRQFRL